MRRLQLINAYVLGFFCIGNVGVSVSFVFQGRYISAVLAGGLALFLYLNAFPRPVPTLTKLRITQAGLDYVRSPAYALEMGGIVSQYWVPEGCFYELLLNVTAIRLLGRESLFSLTQNEVDGFDRFVAENLPIIRIEIDRIKVWQPAIQTSEDDWKKTHDFGFGKGL